MSFEKVNVQIGVQIPGSKLTPLYEISGNSAHQRFMCQCECGRLHPGRATKLMAKDPRKATRQCTYCRAQQAQLTKTVLPKVGNNDPGPSSEPPETPPIDNVTPCHTMDDVSTLQVQNSTEEFSMHATKELVTPKIAKAWLERNVSNRPLSQSNVKRLASALKAGAWSLNGETIKFDSDGRLIDGQHRLEACVIANLAFETLVVHGLAQTAFDTVDQGKPRSGGDVLARCGEKHYNMLAASLRIVYSIKKWGIVGDGFSLRPDEIKKCLDENPGIRDCCSKTVSRYNTGLLRTSITAALLYLFREKNVTDPLWRETSVADRFWDRVINAELLTSDMPEYHLHHRLHRDNRSQAKLRGSDLAALSIKAWNFSLGGKRIKNLSYFEREEFPKIQPE